MFKLRSWDRRLVTFNSQKIVLIQPNSCFAEFNHMGLFSSLLICLSLFGILFYHMNWLSYHVHLLVTLYCPYFYASCRVGGLNGWVTIARCIYADWISSRIVGAYVYVFSLVERSSKQGADGWLPCLWSCPRNGYNSVHKEWVSLHTIIF